MKPVTARKQYTRRMMGAGLGYVVTLMGVTYAVVGLEPSRPVGIALTVIPVVFIMGMLWAVWQFLKDTDEVQRYFLTQSMMLGLFAVLIISGGWGLVEMVVDGVPALPVFWIFPLFFFVMGISQAFNRDQGCLP